MGLLSGIKNYIKTEILGTTGDAKVKPAEIKEVKAPVIQCENVGKNEDTVTINNEPSQVSDDKKMNIGQKRQSIELKCKSVDINTIKVIKDFVDNIGLTQERFDALPAEEKLEVLNAIEFAVDEIIANKNKHGISKQINKEKMVSDSAANIYEGVKDGDIKDLKEFQEDVGDINKELGKDFQKQNVKTRRKILEGIAKRRSEQFEKNLNEELKYIPKSKHEEYIARRRQYYNRVERAIFHDILAVQDSESANLAIVTLNANDMAYGAKTVLKTRINPEERTKAADMQTFGFMQDNLKAYYERGEKIETSVVEEYNSTTTMYKSSQALNNYQQDYKTAREKFESGEEVPPYMSQEIFSSTAKGIGTGAFNNVNMTTEEKAEFLATWEADAKSFSDYEAVTKAIKEEIAKNPEFKEKFEKARQNVVKNKEASSESKKEANNNTETKTKTSFVTNPQQVSAPTITKTETKEATQPKQKEVAQMSKQTKNTKPFEMDKADEKPSSLDEAFQKYGKKDIIKAVLDIQSLRHLRPLVASYLNNMEIVELEEYANSTETFLFILRSVSPQKAAKLFEKRKDLGHDAKVLGEQILERGKNNQNAVA